MTEPTDITLHNGAQETHKGLLGKASGERIFAIVLGAIGVVAFVEGLDYGFIRDDGIIGPGFIPAIVGGLLMVMATLIVASTFRSQQPREADPMEEIARLAREEAKRSGAMTGPLEGEGSQRAALTVFALTGVALVLSRWTGLLIALGLLSFVLMARVEKVQVVRAAIVSTATTAAIWLVFARFLSVPLDFGVFGSG